MQRADHPDDVTHVEIRAAPPGLGWALHRLCGYVEVLDGPLRRREVPWPGIVLIVQLGPPIAVDGELRGSFLAGLSARPTVVDAFGRQAGVQVDLTPLGAHALLGGLPMHELTDRVVDLGDLVDPLLPERLASLPTWDARFDALASWLRRRLEPDRVAPDAVFAWRRILESDGRVGVGELAAELGCSRRHLAARFREQVGLPPKVVARIVRFQRAVRLLDDGLAPGAIAAACGYADQPHLNREFRDLAGCPPAALRTERHGESFPFVQDAFAATA